MIETSKEPGVVKAVFCKVGETPRIVELPDLGESTYLEIKKLVGGHPQQVRMGKFDFICDADRGLKGKPVNRMLPDGRTITGDFVILAFSPHWLVGLSDSEANWLVHDLITVEGK